MEIRHTLMALMLCIGGMCFAQTATQEKKMEQKLIEFFAKYKPKKQEQPQPPKLLKCEVDNKNKTINILNRFNYGRY